MKKFLLTTSFACLMAVISVAQYPQTLPVTHVDFFAESAMGVSPVLEKGNYNSTTEAIMENQWNLTGASATSYEFGSSAVVENSTLSYSNYVDNNAGKAIVFDAAITGQRRTVYSLTSVTGAYRDKGAYYLSFLLNFSTVPATRFFLAWDGNHTANQQRGVLYVKAAEGGYQLGLGLTTTSSTVTVWSSILSLNQTHLVVMKINPISTGDPEKYSFYVNPVVGGDEGNETPVVVFDNDGTAATRISGIKGITIIQNTDTGAKIAGLRFSDNWADAVLAGAPNSTINQSASLSKVVVNAANQIEITAPVKSNYTVYNTMGQIIVNGVMTEGRAIVANLPSSGIYIVKVGNETNKVILK